MRYFLGEILQYHHRFASSLRFPPKWVPFTGCPPKTKAKFSVPETNILLMDKILHHQGWWLSHYLQGFNHPKRCRISSINSSTWKLDFPKRKQFISQPSLQVRFVGVRDGNTRFEANAWTLQQLQIPIPHRVPGHIRIKCTPCTHAVSSVAYLVLGCARNVWIWDRKGGFRTEFVVKKGRCLAFQLCIYVNVKPHFWEANHLIYYIKQMAGICWQVELLVNLCSNALSCSKKGTFWGSSNSCQFLNQWSFKVCPAFQFAGADWQLDCQWTAMFQSLSSIFTKNFRYLNASTEPFFGYFEGGFSIK